MLQDEAPSKWRRRRLDLQLSGALARPFLFEAVDGLKSWREAVSVATTLARDATGLQSECAVWLDDWRPGQSCIAVAVETNLRDQLEATAQQAGFKLAAIWPWWSAAIEAAKATFKETSLLLAVADSDALTVLSGTGAGYSAAATYAPKLEALQAKSVLTRAAMTADLHTADVVWATLVQQDSADPAAAEIDGLAPILERWT